MALCVVGMGVVLGISYHSERIELVYLLAGMALFIAGTLLRGRS